jgi:hypothetical protein
VQTVPLEGCMLPKTSYFYGDDGKTELVYEVERKF